HAAVVQHGFDPAGAADHMVVGQRVAVRRNDHAGARAVIEIAHPAGAPDADHRRTDRVDDLDYSFGESVPRPTRRRRGDERALATEHGSKIGARRRPRQTSAFRLDAAWPT